MPARFCSQCGTKVTQGAKFCAECGYRLDGRGAAPAASGWQVTTAGLSVFGLLLVSGLAIWATILSPTPPKPAPGRGPAAAAGAADSDQASAPGAPMELPQEVKTFVDDLAKKAEAAPDDKDLWVRLGKVYSRAGQIDPSYDPKALAAFEHVLARDPDDQEAIRGKADVFYDENDHKQAIPLLERYLTLAGDDPNARTDLATMYLSAGNAAKAIATYHEVIAKHPDFLQAHYNLAVAHAQLGDDKEALNEFKQARALTTDDKVHQQIDEMVARLKGEKPAVPPPAVTSAGPAPSAPSADSGPRSPFQQDVEKRLRGAPIMGDRIARIDWNGPGSARVLVQNFPMSAMPEEVRGKFTDRLAQELRAASTANQPGGEVKLEIADADAGTVMATVTAAGQAPAAAPAPAADSGTRSPFQQDVEKRLRGAPIMGDRIVRIDWNGPGSARVLVQNFPMSAMPEEVRGKFTDRLAQELRAASGANQPGGEVKLEIADASAGSVMATVTP
jgi:Flp pilus assembly protein TadD